MTMYPEESGEHQVWCVCCKDSVAAGPNTVFMKTAYRLTPKGPISYGYCDACVHGQSVSLSCGQIQK